MKKLIFSSIAVLTFSAGNVSANSNPKLVMQNNNFETKICYVAATQGIDAAKQMVSDKGLSFRRFNKNVTCNNKSISTFARQFAESDSNDEQSAKITLVAKNNDIESKICLESLVNGVGLTAKKYKINSDHIRCNGKPLPRFVRESKKQGATVASIH